jgi:hypothetical protein
LVFLNVWRSKESFIKKKSRKWWLIDEGISGGSGGGNGGTWWWVFIRVRGKGREQNLVTVFVVVEAIVGLT